MNTQAELDAKAQEMRKKKKAAKKSKGKAFHAAHPEVRSGVRGHAPASASARASQGVASLKRSDESLMSDLKAWTKGLL